MLDPLLVAGRSFSSRLITGTGKFASGKIMADALDASGTQLVTVALRRVDLDAPAGEDILDFLDTERYLLLPNTSGAIDASEAIRMAHLARAAQIADEQGRTWIKVEVWAEPNWMLPDPIGTLQACETLVREGFVVLPYIGPDPALAKRLEDVGCATVMPLGSWIGSNQGLRSRDAIELIVNSCSVPVVVDAGLGAPSHAAEAMEMGCDAVLVNTAMATARDPLEASIAFKLAVDAGRRGYLSGLAGAGAPAASSPLTGFLDADR